MLWHVLDVRAVWVKEFAAALDRQVPTLGWLPDIGSVAMFRHRERDEILLDPLLRVRHFPLQRGFARRPLAWLAREASRITRRLLRHSGGADSSVLVCCAPHYAGVVARWTGPSVYYVTDLFVACGEASERIRCLDRRMCEVADIVCPNSRRIASYLVAEANCAEAKIVVIPNATRGSNVLRASLLSPQEVPGDVVSLPRPIAGVIGNLAANMDWELLEWVAGRTPWLSWLFVGPTAMPISEPAQERARRRLMEAGGRVHFVGPRPYGALRDYARSLDVAILPYRRREPTYSGSSTRFYEHLAACRPMLATRGFEELLGKEPLLRLVDSAEEMLTELRRLRQAGFRDGYEESRWHVSRGETWDARAAAMRQGLAERWRSGKGDCRTSRPGGEGISAAGTMRTLGLRSPGEGQ